MRKGFSSVGSDILASLATGPPAVFASKVNSEIAFW
jgi:hypothetical protein